MDQLSQFDKKCLDKALEIAKETFAQGNYPIGAVLAINSEIIDVAGNGIIKQKSRVHHAENTLIINNGERLLQAYESNETVCLYSTLEPCIQCLGSAAINHVSKIFYIQKDPHAGACDINPLSIGFRYKKKWPEIIHVPYTNESKEMMIECIKKELREGREVERAKKFLELLDV